jgi:hypothetical protein
LLLLRDRKRATLGRHYTIANWGLYMANRPALAGKWTYRSYINSTDLVSDGDGALALIFGQGVFTFVTPSSTTVQGTLDMGSGLVLDLQGTVEAGGGNAPAIIAIVGTGRAGTPTDGWE